MEKPQNPKVDPAQKVSSIQEETKTIPSRYNDRASRINVPDKKAEKDTATYNFDDCIGFLNKKGKELFGNHFAIAPSDYEIIHKLLVYIIRDEHHAEKYNLNLNKGILLSGPVGCGKTTLMTLLNYFQSKHSRYAIKSCRDISFEFLKDGYEVIQKYSTNSFIHTKDDLIPRTYYFDDLGTENSLKYYGNECNVMGEIILSRYDLFTHKKMFTHLTTNLTAQEIESFYGSRVRSRMREMFNLVFFDRDIEDKRK